MIKDTIDDLAIFGGTSSFEASLHVGKPNVGNRDHLLARINRVLDDRWFSNNGKLVQEFEHSIEQRLGVKHCIAMCNATVGLEIAIRAAGLQGEVIVPSFTFVATAHALQWQEITPVFCDIDPFTHSLDPHKVERMITPRTTGIIGVHVWGNACNINALTEVAARNNLTLMFDAAHAFGCSYRGCMIGNFGEAEVFSFHATKFLNTFEGGAVVTNNDDLAARIRLMKNFGFAGYDNVVYIGTNGKMTEVAAAMGLTGLDSLDEFIATNRRNYHRYQEGLKGLSGVRFYTYDETEKLNFQYIVLEINEAEAKISRDDLVYVLHAENVLARRYFYPGCHEMEPYRSHFPHAGLLLPETQRISQQVMILPTGTSVSVEDIDIICQLIRLVMRYSAQVSQRLQGEKALIS